MAKPRVLVPLGTGFEELEAIAAVDVLRRAGCQVITASVGATNPIVGRNRIRVLADLDLSDALTEWGDDWDLVLIAGGLGGVEAITANTELMALVRGRIKGERAVAAICAGPRALRDAGLPLDTAITGHPGCADDLKEFTDYRTDAVVRAGSVITSRGAGTAVQFSLACVALLCGDAVADRVRAEIVA
ncbi:MAG: 4-methyl-5(b-hydroxyethyl)-thiazole monophosphate biosynthesis [Myxococcota bacterium]|jgi:4-methyl-5(b-hydroxyethyl)-thiazole monophosphate biosynthesis